MQKKQNQELDKLYEFDKEDEAKKKATSNNYKEWDLACNDKHSFYKYHSIDKLKTIFFSTKYDKYSPFVKL